MEGSVKLLWICWLAAGLGACRPADKAPPAAAELEDTLALASRVDSTHQIGQDGLDYLPLNTGTFQQLPPELTQILDQQYPGWLLPELVDEELKQVDREAQGPYFVRADFDRNGLQDYAVQFQIGDSTLVAAFLRQARQPPLKFILARQPLARIKGEKQSRLVVSQDSIVHAGDPEAKIRLSQPGIAIGRPQDTRVFVFEGGLFSVADKKEADGT
jgi:hypothetical protein